MEGRGDYLVGALGDVLGDHGTDLSCKPTHTDGKPLLRSIDIIVRLEQHDGRGRCSQVDLWLRDKAMTLGLTAQKVAKHLAMVSPTLLKASLGHSVSS